MINASDDNMAAGDQKLFSGPQNGILISNGLTLCAYDRLLDNAVLVSNI